MKLENVNSNQIYPVRENVKFVFISIFQNEETWK